MVSNNTEYHILEQLYYNRLLVLAEYKMTTKFNSWFHTLHMNELNSDVLFLRWQHFNKKKTLPPKLNNHTFGKPLGRINMKEN